MFSLASEESKILNEMQNILGMGGGRGVIANETCRDLYELLKWNLMSNCNCKMWRTHVIYWKELPGEVKTWFWDYTVSKNHMELKTMKGQF